MTNDRAIEVLKAWDLNYQDEFTAHEFDEAFRMAIKALEQEPCEDVISRQAVIRIAEQGQVQGYEWQFKELIKLSPVTPQPKTGHWIKVHPLQADDEGAYMCSCCEVGDWDLKGTEKFCPKCNARMIETQESEDKG